MAERMVRTQIYLPPKIHAELKRRAEKHGLTLALQIRDALEDYLRLMKADEEPLPPFDPTDLFAIIDNLKGGGPPDLSENHDKYLYSDPHGEFSRARQKEKVRKQPESKPVVVVRDRRATYQTQKRVSRKRRRGYK